MMRMNRRDFVKAGAALAGACATGRLPIQKSASTLPPVIVSEERVIRTVAGLRPYRLSGFALRGESLDGKLLIHNYGHGGCGVTLSWGTGKLALEIALAQPQRRAAVLGCGAVGLAAARLLQDHGFDVTIYARELPPDTTSNMAGALWAPITIAERDRHTAEFDAQLAASSRFAYRYFQLLVGDRYGVSWVPLFFLDTKREFPLPWFWSIAPEMYRYETLGPGEHPFSSPFVHRTYTMLIEPSIYLAAVLSDVHVAGGKVVIREFHTLGDVVQLDEPVVVNCTGLGAKALVGDEEVLPIKGQTTFLLPQPEVKYATVSNTEDLYMFSRRDGVLLGGSHEKNVWTLEPNEAEERRIIAGNRKIFSSMNS
jgi:glycine/D-amino acid oxidase-like deaminating enzyme